MHVSSSQYISTNIGFIIIYSYNERSEVSWYKSIKTIKLVLGIINRIFKISLFSLLGDMELVYKTDRLIIKDPKSLVIKMQFWSE